MRSVATALVIVALLAIWLIIQHGDNTGPNETLTGAKVTAATIPHEPDLPLADQEEFQATIPDEVISDTEAITDTIELNTFSGSTVRTSVIEFDPEQRTKIADYLSESGLAVVDSERIADLVAERSSWDGCG